jgi:hypothetical protein
MAHSLFSWFCCFLGFAGHPTVERSMPGRDKSSGFGNIEKAVFPAIEGRIEAFAGVARRSQPPYKGTSDSTP